MSMKVRPYAFFRLHRLEHTLLKGGSTMSGYGGGFALIVVLFILLVIVGASWF